MKVHWIAWVLFGLALLVSTVALVLMWNLLQGRGIWQTPAKSTPASSMSTEENEPTVSPALFEVELNDGRTIRQFQTGSQTVLQALEAQGVQVASDDLLVPDGSTQISGNLKIELRRAVPLTVQTKTGSLSIRAVGNTVGEALARSGFAPQNMDYSVPALDDSLPLDGIIRLVRVSEQVAFDQTMLPYQTEYRPDSTLDLETSKELQAGQQGVDVNGERIRIEDSQQTGRQKLTQWRAKEAQNRIVGYGTQAVKKVLDAGGEKIEYWMSLTMYATSYSPCRLGKPDYCHYTTGTGAKLQRGVVAVTRTDYAAFGGSQVYIPGYGSAVIADIGGGIPGKRWIDLGYSDEDYKAWASNVTVYFLWPPPAGYLTSSSEE